MAKAIDQALRTVLKYKHHGNDRTLDRALDAVMAIGEAVRKSRTRLAAIGALREMAAGADPRMRLAGVAWMAEVADVAAAELEPDLRAALADSLTCPCGATGLYRARGADAFPDIVEAVADKSLSDVARVGLLDLLAFLSCQPWGAAVPPDLAGIQEQHFSLRRLRAWVKDGCPLGDPMAPVPTAELKKLGFELPDEYREFLKSHRGGTPFVDRSGDLWNLTPARHLLTERPFLETRSANVTLLRTLIETEGDVILEDNKRGEAARQRLQQGVVIGSCWQTDTELLLFLDPTKDHSVWAVDTAYMDLRRKGAGLSDWLRKVKPVQFACLQNTDALADIAALGGILDGDQDGVSSVNLTGQPVSDELLTAIRKIVDLTGLFWNNVDDQRINDAMQVVSTITTLDDFSAFRTPLHDQALLQLKTLWDVKTIEVWDTKVTERGAEKLRAALPKTEIVTVSPLQAGEEEPPYRCPVEGCIGWVDEIEDDEGNFWGCAECVTVWLKKSTLYAAISDIVKQHPHRQSVYRRSGKTWLPVDLDDEPEDYEERVEAEEVSLD